LCEHLNETLTIPKKSYAENWNLKKKVAVRFYLMTFSAYVDYFIVCYKVELIKVLFIDFGHKNIPPPSYFSIDD